MLRFYVITIVDQIVVAVVVAVVASSYWETFGGLALVLGLSGWRDCRGYPLGTAQTPRVTLPFVPFVSFVVVVVVVVVVVAPWVEDLLEIPHLSYTHPHPYLHPYHCHCSYHCSYYWWDIDRPLALALALVLVLALVHWKVLSM